MLRGLLLFLAGLLAGANLVYFLMTRSPWADAAAPRAAVAAEEAPASAAGAPSASPAAPPYVSPGGAATATDATTGGEPAEDRPTPARAADAAPPAATPAGSASRPPARTPADAGDLPPALRGLLLPVRGVDAAALTDTYNDTRGGARIHEALDIMAARGTPVVAAADGTVVKLFTSRAGGLTVYQFDPGRTHAYYYAHLDAYAPGLKEGRRLRRGDPVGTVGSTGNASPDAPHLHFAIFRLGPERRWWEGTPVNPYPLLTGR